VVGVGRGRANLDAAQRLSIIDRQVTLDADWTAELADADLVLVATPVAQYPALFAAMAGRLAPKTIVTDAGSTKQDVIATARATLGAALRRFVPGHPIAGTERSGATAAFDTLFAERNVVLTPIAETDPAATATVASLWSACGGRVRHLDAAAHDRVFAAVSHLPHLLAFALVDAFAARDDAAEIFRFAASGFRDFTRIAGSSPEMWRDISLANRVALSAEVAAFRTQLDRVAAMVAAGDGDALAAVFTRASEARRQWEAQHQPKPAAVPADGPRET
jgi:prephenate dehydrogenase